ncbi:hypothetical protein BHE90_008843 [Fusarium euwallaceae]|uniref:Secreted protein n=1 Tax=Fusarium euwallaceae TaxID=1147111 RepID=A0A430LLT6_9HYPO|nr:hypothetical protein BHE90_008843 [Fusarium euwallaceae]
MHAMQSCNLSLPCFALSACLFDLLARRWLADADADADGCHRRTTRPCRTWHAIRHSPRPDCFKSLSSNPTTPGP